MQIARLILVTFLVLSSPQIAAAMDAPEESYEVLLARLTSGDVDIDYEALRLSYVQTPAYSPYGGAPINALYEASNSGDHTAAIAEAERIFESEYINMEAHWIAAQAHEALGDAERAEFHHAIAAGLHQSIFDSGDGRSVDSPHLVIRAAEEYSFLRLMGIRVTGQSLFTGERLVDALRIEDASSGEDLGTAHFDIGISFVWMDENLLPEGAPVNEQPVEDNP